MAVFYTGIGASHTCPDRVSGARLAPSAIIVRDGCVLLARRPEGKSFAGLWETPGGKAEEGEDARATLARELREELGCESVIGEGVAEAWLSPPVTSQCYRIPFYVCTLLGEPRPLVASELRWCTAEEAVALPLTPASAHVVERGVVARVLATLLRRFRDSAADALADEVAVLIRRGVVDSHSPAADALLDYCDSSTLPRGIYLSRSEAREVAVALFRSDSGSLDPDGLGKRLRDLL